MTSAAGTPLMICRPQALILSPTRELATQTQKNITIIGENMKVVAHACIGGKSIGTLPSLNLCCSQSDISGVLEQFDLSVVGR